MPRLNALTEQGQLAVVLPISLAMAVGGSLLWGYVEMMQSQQASIRGSSEINVLMRTLSTRIQNYLSGPYLPCKDPQTGMKQMFVDFRNFSTTTPVSWKWPPPGGPTPAPGAVVTCLLGDTNVGQDPAEPAIIKSLSITIARIGTADPVGFSSQIEVSIQAYSNPTALNTSSAQASRGVSLSHQYMLQAGRLGTYQTVLLPATGAAVGSEQITTPDGGTADFMGSIFVSGNMDIATIAPLPTSLATVPTVTFEKPVDSRAYFMLYNAAATFNLMDTAITSKVFTKGLNYNVFGTLAPPAPFGNNIATIPMVDGPPSNGTNPVWNWSDFTQILDYNGVYGAGATAYPIPDVQTGTVGTDLNSQYFPPPTPSGSFVAAPGAGASTSCIDPATNKCFNAAKAQAIASIPDASGVVPSLDYTCGSNSSTIPTFVYQRLQGTTDKNGVTFGNTLDIFYDKGCGAPGCDPVFCGLVAVDTLTLHAPNNTTYGFYGNIVAKKIVIRGAGHVFFANPADGVPISGLAFSQPNDSQQSVGNLFSQIQNLATNTAANFFVPFYFLGALQTSNYYSYPSVMPKSAGYYMQPCVGDPNNIGGSIATYCMQQVTAAQSGYLVPWGSDVLPMSLTVMQ